jgi:hypothetical protein
MSNIPAGYDPEDYITEQPFSWQHSSVYELACEIQESSSSRVSQQISYYTKKKNLAMLKKIKDAKYCVKYMEAKEFVRCFENRAIAEDLWTKYKWDEPNLDEDYIYEDEIEEVRGA